MSETLAIVNAWLDSLFAYGPVWVYATLWVACFVENIFPPFPGDTFIFAGGALVALGRLDLMWLMVTVNVGGMASVMALYYLGKRYGHDYFVRKNYKYFSADDVRQMESRLARYGAVLLIVSRFIVGFRSALAISAGIGRYNAGKTLIFSLVSYVAFTSLIVYIAVTLVEHLDSIDKYVTAYNWIVWPVLIGLVATFVVKRYRSVRKKRTP